MKRFSQLQSKSQVLVLDATSAQVQVGLFLAPCTQGRYAYSNEESGIGLFQAVQSLGCNLEDIKTFVYANSPGSILGIRTVAMALRIWKTLSNSNVYAYNALSLLAEANPNSKVTYIADARRDMWHTYSQESGYKRMQTDELVAPLALPEGFRTWSSLPSNLTVVPYCIEKLWPKVLDIPLLTESENPDAFLYEQPSYVTWEPQIHRKPVT
jgi:tRNA threonylcarbamoyladenosine biosynthesis protein TsaB